MPYSHEMDGLDGFRAFSGNLRHFFPHIGKPLKPVQPVQLVPEENISLPLTPAHDRAVQAAGAPLSRRAPVPAAAEITRYVGRALAEAGLGLGGEYLAHQSFAGPLSAAKRQAEALDARRELWDRGVRERRRSAHKERRPR